MRRAELSVIIPCYDCEDTIERAVDSVLSQTLLPHEIILVDDHSRDGSLEKMSFLERTIEAVPIKVIALHKNSGPSYARNRGWEIAKYPYIAFLDSDDSWENDKIKTQYGSMSDDPGISLSGHLVVWDRKSPASKKIYSVLDVKSNVISPWKILLSNSFKTTSTIMVRRDVSIRFPEDKRHAEDLQFLCEVILGGQKAVRIELPLVRQYKAPFGSGGLSKDIWLMVKGESEMYSRFYKSGRLSLVSFLFLVSYLYLKSLRRVVIVFFLKKKSKMQNSGSQSNEET